MARIAVTNQVFEAFDPYHRVWRAFVDDLEMGELDSHPVVNVSWYEAEIFCAWAAQLFPGVRLPSEVEWEKAASWDGARKVKYPWGDSWDAERLNIWESGPNRTTKVGSYPSGASPVGALDMAGNVWEWCLDWFVDDLAVLAEPPRAESSLYYVERGDRRVNRGGGWYYDVGRPATFLRAADFPTDRFSRCGFRVVRSAIDISRGLDLAAEVETGVT